jgi:HJR/Mrr/RecB family endonuclease
MPIVLILLLSAPIWIGAWLMTLPRPVLLAGGAFIAWLAVSAIARRVRRREARRAALIAFQWNDGMSDMGFERRCAEYLREKGWSAVLTPRTGDQGVDVIADKSGARVAIQCKLYSGAVGNKAVQEVIAGRIYYGADTAAVVSNAGFTRSAIELAHRSNVHLMHFTELAGADALWL